MRVSAGGGPAQTYRLTAEANNLFGLKTFNLDPLDHLIVKQVDADQPAKRRRIKVDDEVVAFAGFRSASQQQFVNLVQKRGGKPAQVTVLRGGGIWP